MQATAIATSTFFLNVKTLSQGTANLSYDDLLALPKTTVDATLYCYGNLVASGSWSGVKLTDLFSQVGGIDEKVRSLDIQAEDGYRIDIPIETAMRPDVIIAYEKDEIPLAETLRLVIPDVNGDVWIAQITSIEMSTQEVGTSLSTNSAMAPIDSIFSNLRQQTPQPLPTPTSEPDSENSVEPVIPPTNAAQPEVTPENQTTKPPSVGAPAWNFTVELVYMLVLALILVVVSTVFVFFYRKKTML